MSKTRGTHYGPSWPSLFVLRSYFGDPGESPPRALWEVYETLEDAMSGVINGPERGELRWRKGHDITGRPEWEGKFDREHEDERIPRWEITEVAFIREVVE